MKKLQIIASFVLAGVISTTAAQPSRPNILYFYVDDMGWGSIGPNGQTERKARGLPYVLTPNLDRLAAAGVNFTRSYGCTVCSPARSSQQTGFHQGHTFADRNDPNNAKKAIRADDVTMGDALAKAGYMTGYWGKWGYGGSKSQPDPVIENVQTLPTSHGYQHVVAELHHVRAHTFFQPTLWNAPAKAGAIGGLELKLNSMASYVGDENYPATPALQNHPDYPTTAYCDDVYAFAALDFVRNGGKAYNASGKPFFGLLAVQVPHAPFGEIEKLPEWDKAYRDLPFFAELSDQAKQWAAMVTRLDAHFGNILEALEDPDGDGDTSDSVAANTLVIFQSDNGGPQHAARKEFAANGGLRESKGKIEEGGIRIPTIMRWPAKITKASRLKAGTSSARVIDVTDLLPTFCELAGVQAPVGIDGVSIAPTLIGAGHQRRREFLIHEAGNGQSIIRGRHKLIRPKKGALQLYDLEADYGEANDIAGANPGLVKELETLLLGERVAEPRGFANTYHRWIGETGAKTSDPGNWSDYEYANAGVAYMKDKGAPRVSWNAVMENNGSGTRVAYVDEDLEFLGLEIRGKLSPAAKQTLSLGPGIKLAGRNGIRLSANSKLTLNKGMVSSLRSVDLRRGSVLQGVGTIDADLFNDSAVSTHGELKIVRDYWEMPGSTLNVILDGGNATLEIGGEARLAGELQIVVGPNLKTKFDRPLTILKARNISGVFANSRSHVVLGDGRRLKISYTKTSVSLTVL